MFGVSHPSFNTAIELAHYAEDLGAAAIQVLALLRARTAEFLAMPILSTTSMRYAESRHCRLFNI